MGSHGCWMTDADFGAGEDRWISGLWRGARGSASTAGVRHPGRSLADPGRTPVIPIGCSCTGSVGRQVIGEVRAGMSLVAAGAVEERMAGLDRVRVVPVRPRGSSLSGVARRSEPDGVESSGASAAEKADRRGNGAEIEEPGQCDSEISQGRHGTRRALGSDLGAVLVERDIADPVATVLDRPVSADYGEELLRCGSIWAAAGDDVDALLPRCSRLHVRRDALQLRHLSAVGEVHEAVEFRRSPDSTNFQPPVPLLDRFMLRGGEPSDRTDGRCHC